MTKSKWFKKKNSELSPLEWLTFANLCRDKPYLYVAVTNDSIGHHQIFKTVAVRFKFPCFLFSSKLEYSALLVYLQKLYNLFPIWYFNSSHNWFISIRNLPLHSKFLRVIYEPYLLKL